jgi:hypothetical protein
MQYLQRIQGYKEENYDEGVPTSSQQLMKLAENEYKLMKEVNEWQSPDDNDEECIALQAQF